MFFCLLTFISFAGTVYELLSKRGSLAPGQDWSLFVWFLFLFVCLFVCSVCERLSTGGSLAPGQDCCQKWRSFAGSEIYNSIWLKHHLSRKNYSEKNQTEKNELLIHLRWVSPQSKARSTRSLTRSPPLLMPHPSTSGKTDQKKNKIFPVWCHIWIRKKTYTGEKLNGHSKLIVDQFSEK